MLLATQQGPSWCAWCGGHMGWGGWMMFFWMVILALVVAAIWWQAQRGGRAAAGVDRAEAILRERFARGEIDQNSYRQQLAELKHSEG